MIKQAVEAEDDATAKRILEDYEITMERGKITFVYDQKGASYKTPIAVINEPVGYGVDKEEMRLSQHIKPPEIKEVVVTI